MTLLQLSASGTSYCPGRFEVGFELRSIVEGKKKTMAIGKRSACNVGLKGALQTAVVIFPYHPERCAVPAPNRSRWEKLAQLSSAEWHQKSAQQSLSGQRGRKRKWFASSESFPSLCADNQFRARTDRLRFARGERNDDNKRESETSKLPFANAGSKDLRNLPRPTANKAGCIKGYTPHLCFHGTLFRFALPKLRFPTSLPPRATAE
ncbi:hypothetical protein HPB50_027066 [Hyalomma asiaticum]|uniref:Uncharacterized protein n=1 Tax=Hyalomma asiaticum TaxID=266040 RepID=A0ACB7RS32_HYAAI|nr:hypothetical protein HPB50_027066 [Hyalomma asiaticum]